MSALPIIYSPIAMRGKIILKALMVDGIDARYFSNIDEAKSASVDSNSPIIILDAKNHGMDEIKLVQFFSFDLPYSFIIVFSGNGSSKKIYWERPDHIYTVESFNPEEISSLSRNIIKKLYGKVEYENSASTQSMETSFYDEIFEEKVDNSQSKQDMDHHFKPDLVSNMIQREGNRIFEKQADNEITFKKSEKNQDTININKLIKENEFQKDLHLTPLGPQPYSVIQNDVEFSKTGFHSKTWHSSDTESLDTFNEDFPRWEWGSDESIPKEEKTVSSDKEIEPTPITGVILTHLKSFSRIAYKTSVLLSILLVGLVGGYLYWCISMVPDVTDLRQHSPFKSSKIFSYDNNLLSEFFRERRTSIPYHKIPQHVIDALITAEDYRYFKHGGIDPVRILGALYKDLKKGGYQEGGSTITQQLAKMVFLTPDKTITRKIQEVFLSFNLEKTYSKHEILEFYFNKAYFGSRAYGIEAASQTYFNKSVSQITVSEAALLAALLKAPSVYSPFKDPNKSLNRRNWILKRLFETKSITKKVYQTSLKESLPIQYHGRKYTAPYFVEHCKTLIEKKYGSRLYTSGLAIYTTLDNKMQQIAEDAVAKGVSELNKRGNTDIQASLVAIEVHTGKIKAMVGGTSFWESQFNRATQAKRQPGSAFKPIVFLTALEQGFSTHDIIQDLELTYVDEDDEEDGIWTPKNYNGKYYGPVTLTIAMSHSLNAATVNLANLVRIKNVIQSAKNLGIQSKIHPLYSSALGASETTLLELVCAYASLSHGRRIRPICIDRIIDRERSILYEPSDIQKQIINDSSIENIRKMLRSVITDGTGKAAASLKRTVYGKTGTTNDHADALFVGFDDNIALGVWVGRDNHKPIGPHETGASAALPIWLHFMKEISD